MAEANNPADQEPVFNVHNIYSKDVSYEAPNTPHVFAAEWKPHLDFDLQMGSHPITDGVHEVILDVTVTVKLDVNQHKGTEHDDNKDKNEKVAFLIEVKQAGIFSAQGFSEDQVEKLLATTAPGILFPYVREVVTSIVVKGGFPQLVLPPMNFDAMYQEHLEKTQKDQKAQ